jgi:hypothetical protein
LRKYEFAFFVQLLYVAVVGVNILQAQRIILFDFIYEIAFQTAVGKAPIAGGIC